MAEEKKKKKEKVNINMPKARAQYKRQKEVGQMKQNREDLSKLIYGLVIGLIVFALLTGIINQRKVVETVKKWSQGVGNNTNEYMNSKDLEVNDDGVYIKDGEESK